MTFSVSLAGDFVVKPGAQLLARQLADWEIVYFPVASATEYEVFGQSWCLARPSLVLTRPGTVHSYRFDRQHSTRHLFAHFRCDLSMHPALAEIAPCMVVPALPILLAEPAFSQVMRLAHRQEPLWRIRASALIMTMVYELVGTAIPMSPANPRNEPDLPIGVRLALSYIQQHFAEPIGVADMAAAVGWSHAHLARTFAHYLHEPPSKVLLQHRVAEACKLLQESHRTIQEVAYMVGFRDESYFSRVFSRLKGISASQYRQQLARDRHTYYADYVDEEQTHPLNQYFSFADAP